jgi:hypothetical protein
MSPRRHVLHLCWRVNRERKGVVMGVEERDGTAESAKIDTDVFNMGVYFRNVEHSKWEP